MNESDYRVVYSAKNSTVAHFMKIVLEAEGIDAQVMGDALQGALGDLPAFDVEPKLWVRITDYDRARQVVVAEGQRQHDPSGAMWDCDGCGESNEPSFDLCWKCQAERVLQI